jgi:class 3 adenylate cyclase
MIESGTWTVLFTDIVGSTELRTQLGDDEADVLFGVVDRAVAAAVDKHQGVLVKGLGDGPMAAFARGRRDRGGGRDPAGCSPRRTRRAESRLSAGDARAEGDDLFGTPVVEAARLCSAAEGSQILVAALVKMLAGTRGGHEFEPVVR